NRARPAGALRTCAGARLAATQAMRRHCVLVLLVLASVPGCKSMGAIGSGFGKIAAGAASGIAHAAPVVAKGVAKVAPAIARTAASGARGRAHAGPHRLRAAEAVAEATLRGPDIIVIEAEPPPPPALADPCQACPVDDCGTCAGFAGYACVASPAGALAR